MSATGLDVFDKTLQATHVWLNDIMSQLGTDRSSAWHVLGAVLCTVRDRVPLELAAHLGAELPILVRGTYYDEWRPAKEPERYRSLDEFLRRVVDHMGAVSPIRPQEAARTVFDVLGRHVSDGQARKVCQALPEDVRMLWPMEAGADEPEFADQIDVVTAQPEQARNILT
jgi:uncharacterized protein (DUF2267 family)